MDRQNENQNEKKRRIIYKKKKKKKEVCTLAGKRNSKETIVMRETRILLYLIIPNLGVCNGTSAAASR